MARVRVAQENDPQTGSISLGGMDKLIGFHLRRAQEASFSHFAKLAGQDLDPGRFAILTIIGNNKGINQTALSEASGRDKSTLTVTLNLLLKQGLIERERVPSDRRHYAIKLTPAGERHLAALSICAAQHEADLDRIVGTANKQQFILLLSAIADTFA